jgi:transcription initiation factor IIE alpha subunit
MYVELFRLYLFGSFKVSAIAKELLDYEEFDITPRVIRKAEKHWKHYVNNVKHDEVFEIKKAEVEEMLNDLRNFLEETDQE